MTKILLAVPKIVKNLTTDSVCATQLTNEKVNIISCLFYNTLSLKKIIQSLVIA